MGEAEEEKAERLQAFANFQVTPALMQAAKLDAVFMHCLPAHREQEVLSQVIDGPHSIVFKQSENRLWTAQAILFALLNNLLIGN
ncbi:MAG: ornithine carbamoyltransferase [Francisellaceae bacterium]|nr:ornithine carbamoyltransferase [Francisellaceae bacterium]